MKRYDNLEQGSNEWHELRKKYPMTASRTPMVMGYSPFAGKEKLAQELKFGVKHYYSAAMRQGNEREDEVREYANEELGDVFMPTIGVKDDMLASLDGINFDGNAIIEIKVSDRTFEDVDEGTIPQHYLYQIFHQMIVFDTVEKGYLVAYSPEKDDMVISDPITRDDLEGKKERILKAWDEFFEYMGTYELPKENDVNDPNALSIAHELFEISQKKKEIEAKEKELKEKLKPYAESADKIRIANLTISKSVRTSIEYKRLIQDLDIDNDTLSKYKKKSKPSISFRFSA